MNIKTIIILLAIDIVVIPFKSGLFFEYNDDKLIFHCDDGCRNPF